MNAAIRIWTKGLIAALIFFSAGLSQTRRTTRSRATPPFVKQLVSFDETPQVTKAVFKNGMTVLVNEYRAHPVVSVQAYIRSGFLHEPLKNPGIASLLEGMVYRGSTDDAMGTTRQQTQTFGGTLRSTTEHEYTCFEIVALSSQWRKALNVQAEALLNPSLDADALKIEARLLASKALAALDNPYELAREELFGLGFNQPRMGLYSTVARSSLGNITMQKLAEFHQSVYVPNRILLVVSGDVSASEILNEVVRIYEKSLGAAVRMKTIPFQAAQNGFRYIGLRGDVPVPQILLGFHTVAANHRDHPALSLLSAVLGLGEGSVLNRRLRDQKKLILAQETELMAHRSFGYLILHIETEFGNMDRSEIEIFTEIELLKRAEIGRSEIRRARAQLEREYWTRLETATGRARSLAQFEFEGDWRRMEQYISRLRSVQPSDVQRVAKKYLTLDNCSLLEFLPEAEEERSLTTDSIRRTLAGLINPSADQEQQKREKETIFQTDIPKTSDDFKFSEIRFPFVTASILRGSDIFIREDHTTPLINMGLFFPGGKLEETEMNAGITLSMIRMMLQGTQETDSARFHRQLEIYGAQLLPVVADDYFGFYFTVLSGNFGPAFNLFLEAVTSPNFDPDELDRQRSIQSAEILKRNSSEIYPHDLVHKALFKGFSYAFNPYGTTESLLRITPEQLQSWYDRHLKNRRPVVVIIGDSKGTSLAEYFVKNFSGSRFLNAEISDQYAHPLETGESINLNRNGNRATVLIGFQAPPMDDEDRYAAALLESYAGGQGRLSQQLRDRYGIAFSVSLQYNPRLRGGSIIAEAAVNTDSEEEGLEFLKKEIALTVEGPKTSREYRSALNAAAGAFAIRSQTRLLQITDVVKNVLAGNGIEGYRNYSATLQNVHVEDFKDVVRRILDLDRAVILHTSRQSSPDEARID